MFLQKTEKDATEVSLGYLLDAAGNETGVVALEIVTPVRGLYTLGYTSLMDEMQRIRYELFGYKRVIDLLNVPLEVGVKLDPAENVNAFTIYEAPSHRNRYVFVGTPKPEFSHQRRLSWNGHPLIEAVPLGES